MALLPLSALCYALMLPYYELLLASFANAVFEAVSSPLNISIGADAHVIVWRVAEAGIQERYDPNVLFLNLVILPPLLLASPGKLVHRVRALAVSGPFLVALDLMLFLVLLRTRLCLSGDPDGSLCVWGWGLLMTSGQVTAVLAWALLSRRFILPGAMARRISGPRPGRNLPCPCGSARKYKDCCGDALARRVL
jgi:hypothetical protein